MRSWQRWRQFVRMIWRVLQNVLNHLFGTRRPSMKAVSEFQMQRLDFEDWETAK